MNVREYILYIRDLRAHKKSQTLSQFLEEVRERQSSYFNSAKELMHRYLEKYLDEDSFIGHCLPRLHADPKYLETLKREVVESTEYADNMTTKLQTIYESLYGERMDDADVGCLFARIKSQGTELVDESLNEKVASFKVETDEMLQRIFDIFFKVLDREPDSNEQTRYIEFIRENNSLSMTDVQDRIVHDLKDSLEFHDILKRNITTAYAKFSRDALFPSKVYAILQTVLPFKHAPNIDEIIDQTIKELVTVG
jgi:hypothetical protein